MIGNDADVEPPPPNNWEDADKDAASIDPALGTNGTGVVWV